MGKLYFTGDTHSEFRRFTTERFPQQYEMAKEDFVIICGDFGGIWDRIESQKEKYWLDWLDEKPWTTLFVDGNHENFDRLKTYPVEEWHGGQVHRIRSSVFHLMRGEVFEFGDKKLFAFGGAASHDIQDGILDGSNPQWRKMARQLTMAEKYSYRVEGISWWKEELPNEEEMERGLQNLKRCGNEVDYIVTHCPSGKMLSELGVSEANRLTKYLDMLQDTVMYKHWYAGHVHKNRVLVDVRAIVLYNDIRAEEGGV